MSDQKLILTIGHASEFPDAGVVARRVIAAIGLLEAIDRRQWQVGQPRYKWVISRASVQSPAQITLQASKTNRDAKDVDAASLLLDGLEKIVGDDLHDWPEGFSISDTKYIRKLAGRDKVERGIPLRIHVPGRDASEGAKEFDCAPSRLYKRTNELARMAKVREEYIATEGYLAEIEAWESKYDFRLVELDSGREIICHFDKQHTAELGQHLEHRLYVEGVLKDTGIGRPILQVDRFRLVPKDPIGLDEVHRRGLRVPEKMSPLAYVHWLRAQAD